MNEFKVDTIGGRVVGRHLTDVGHDVTRARTYVVSNVKADPWGPELLVRLLSTVDEARGAITDMLDQLQPFLEQTGQGVIDAMDLYREQDALSMQIMESTYPDPPARPDWNEHDIPQDNKVGPTSVDEAEDWEDYVDEHDIDLGPSDPVVVGPGGASPTRPDISPSPGVIPEPPEPTPPVTGTTTTTVPEPVPAGPPAPPPEVGTVPPETSPVPTGTTSPPTTVPPTTVPPSEDD